jgi:hypothetical protein
MCIPCVIGMSLALLLAGALFAWILRRTLRLSMWRSNFIGVLIPTAMNAFILFKDVAEVGQWLALAISGFVACFILQLMTSRSSN